MIYKYEMACKEAGLSEEKIKEIRQIFDTDKKKLKRENEYLEKNDIRYFSISDVDQDAEDIGDYSLIDTSVNVEMDVIKKLEMEKLMCYLNELPVDDREFLYLCFGEVKENDTAIAKKLGLPRTTVQSRKKKLLTLLRNRFEEKNKN